ncbi:hypothetical protein [Acinetobacter sp. MD2(2019)]|uniref:hypothetical protein n=1 Tax=Acinetobacter sp. MD2(2019) TaxID=2605273 RepID=UPI002D1E95FF|nr:hypothetical protein [Acinetobacter sp. MD2(2019)]MEB3755199.1 hypothetical protein [Acinetobacter sp. MD2(2019)]
MKKLLAALSLSLVSSVVLAQANTVTVVVKKIEGFGESGDAFIFRTTTGQRYQVYNAGGSNPIRGEALLSDSVKTRKAVCLHLDANKTKPRLVQSVHQGACTP